MGGMADFHSLIRKDSTDGEPLARILWVIKEIPCSKPLAISVLRS
jgi:hypothetical protein